MMTENEEYENFLKEHAILESLFPDVGFDISVPLENLDDIVSPFDHIIIKNVFDCHCYDERPKNTDYIDIKKKGGNITIRDVLNELNRIKYCCECSHTFFESVTPSIDSSGNKSSTQFEIFFGS
jgi:hypothetical protein